MQLQAARQLSFLDTLTVSCLLPSHQMVHCLCLVAGIKLSNSGMYRLVELSRPLSMLNGFPLFLYQLTAALLLQELRVEQFICGTFRQGSASVL